jgi:tetratricopeptide (TPR) repeat protein
MAMNRCSIISLPAIWLVTIGFSVNYATCRGDETPPAPDVAITDDEAQSLLAYERFLQVLRQHPGIGTALEHVYSFHLERGTVDEFLTSLVEAEARETDGVSITIRGLVELQRGHDEEAAEILRAAEQQRLNDPMVAWALARALNRTGEFAESANALERAIERNPERGDLLSIFQELNRTYRRSQQHEKAADVWNRMEKLFPNDLRVKEQIANSLYEEGDFRAALPRFQELAKLSSDPYLATQASVFAAEIMLRLDQKDEALKSFESLLNQLDPDGWLHRDIRQRIESVFVKSGDYAGLATYYESWLKTHPDDVDAMARLGRSLAYLGRFDDARKWYADALKRAPSNVGLREAMIEQLVREENYAEAIGHYEQLYKAGVATSDHIQEWGFLFISRKDLPTDQRQTEAAEVWMLLLRDKSDDAVTVSHVADLMRDANLTDRAMTLYQRAITLAPDQPQYKVDLGDLYHSLQQRDKALEIWRAIAAGDLRTTENLVRLANVLRNHDYRDEALQTMRDVVEMSPTFHHHIRLAQMLRDIALSGDRGRLEESLAQVSLASAIAESPEEHETVLQERIRGLQDLGRLQSVADELTQQLAANQDATANDWRTLALYRAALDDLPAATAAIETAIKADNSSVAVWKTAADLFEHAGRLSDAGDALRRLADLDRRFRGEHLLQIVSLERQLGQIQGALEAAKQLLATAPGNPDHLQTYADLCFQAGDIEEGLNTLRRAVRVNSSDEKSLLALAQGPD